MVGGDSLEKRYELVERIAVGGMAEVFRAKAYGPHGFEKLLAIKRILPTLSADPAFERRFIEEAKVAVSLSHANIVQVFDFSRFGQSMYIVMELVDGCDLAHLLKDLRRRGELIPIDAALHIAVDMLKGLDFAHRRQVTHRDVSPSNILLSRHGEVKIADFGIAKVAGFEGSKSMRIMGKWRYMSPEQTQAGELDVRSDVFSAATVIFEVLTGERLFAGSDAEHIVRSIRNMPIPSVVEIRSELPREIDRVLGRALERDRERRYASAGELLEDVLEVCYARSVPALPTSLTRFLERLGIPDQSTGDTGSDSTSSDRLLDQILASELGIGRKAGAAERKTGVALGPPPMHPDDLAEPATPPPGSRAAMDDTGSITVIRSFPDRDGSRRWALEGPLAAELGEDLDATTTLVAIVEPPAVPDEDMATSDTAATVPELPAFGVPAEPGPSRSAAAMRTRWPLWAALAGGAVIAVMAVIGLTRGSRGDSAEPAAAPAVGGGVASAPPPDGSASPRVTAMADASVAPGGAADAGDTVAAVSIDAGDGASMNFVAERVDDAPEASERARPRTGTIDIYSEPWANVYLGRRKVGVAPQRGLRLPVGRHRLKLINPVQKRETTVMVTVPSDRPIRVALP